MISPRWKKVVRDISQNKTRSLLVVSSIAIGVFAIGAVLTSSVVLGREMDRHWKKAAPNHARISLSGIGEDWVKAVRAMPGIADAEARSSTYAYVVMPLTRER